MIILDAVNYSVGTQHILKNLNLQLQSGHFLALVGPSGAGKTSLLRLIAGLETPTHGRVIIDNQVASDADFGTALPSRQRSIGYVFQEFALWPHMSVEQHLQWPLKLARADDTVREQRIDSLLDIVQLTHRRQQFPDTLSGGEQQRLALARALVCNPNILLLDEPFASLDTHLKVELRQILRQLHEQHGTTTLLVTHDQQEAMALADRIAVMIAGEIVQIDSARQ